VHFVIIHLKQNKIHLITFALKKYNKFFVLNCDLVDKKCIKQIIFAIKLHIFCRITKTKNLMQILRDSYK